VFILKEQRRITRPKKEKLRDHWEDLDVGGRITLSWTLGI
jgi:hypothetical protein